MSVRNNAAVVAAADNPSAVPVFDRVLDLVEAPLGARALLSGLSERKREGGPLSVLVRFETNSVAFSSLFSLCRSVPTDWQPCLREDHEWVLVWDVYPRMINEQFK